MNNQTFLYTKLFNKNYMNMILYSEIVNISTDKLFVSLIY